LEHMHEERVFTITKFHNCKIIGRRLTLPPPVLRG
jgi:hypothetical protein